MSGVAKYRKKPVVIEAIQFLGKANWLEVNAFIGDAFSSIGTHGDKDEAVLGLKTLEGTMYASECDWIIRGVEGEIYSCRESIFEATYEEVKEP